MARGDEAVERNTRGTRPGDEPGPATELAGFTATNGKD